jgi:hypothetical protein
MKNINNNAVETKYLVTTNVSGWIRAADRAYFSKPVLVEVLASAFGPTGHCVVRDPKRDHTYPCSPKNLKTKYHLTKKQLEAAG